MLKKPCLTSLCPRLCPEFTRLDGLSQGSAPSTFRAGSSCRDPPRPGWGAVVLLPLFVWREQAWAPLVCSTPSPNTSPSQLRAQGVSEARGNSGSALNTCPEPRNKTSLDTKTIWTSLSTVEDTFLEEIKGFCGFFLKFWECDYFI